MPLMSCLASCVVLDPRIGFRWLSIVLRLVLMQPLDETPMRVHIKRTISRGRRSKKSFTGLFFAFDPDGGLCLGDLLTLSSHFRFCCVHV